MNTALARYIDYSKDKIRYDAACRNILADKHILAWILKGTLTEYKDNTIEEILKCIEPPEVGSVRVEDTNAPENFYKKWGSRGTSSPCRVKGQSPLWGMGQRPIL